MPFIIFWGYLYYLITSGDARLFLMILFTALYIWSFYLFLKKLSVNVSMWFDNNYLYIQKNQNGFLKFLKDDIEGFYCY